LNAWESGGTLFYYKEKIQNITKGTVKNKAIQKIQNLGKPEVGGMQRRNFLLILALFFIALTGLMLGLLSAKIEQAAESGRALSLEDNYALQRAPFFRFFIF
jgi:hypothetical protein